jgi:2-hydroxychromene-2-carboxylate isomerase
MSESELIKFYYDFKSPFTYLAFGPALELEKTHRVELRFIPHVFDFEAYGGMLERRSERDWFKVRYLYQDARRFARERGIIIRGPQKLFDSRVALISGLFAERQGKFRAYAAEVFRRFFLRELNIEDVDALAGVVSETGMDAGEFRQFVSTTGQEALREALAEGERDGVFGVPLLFVAGEPFWGNDRIPWLIKKLDTMGLRRQA